MDDEPEEESTMSLELIVDKKQEDEGRKDAIAENNIYDFDLETIRDKPWLKPGADITDYFNYGFTESTWMKYCEIQRENREFASRFNKHERALPQDDRYGGRRWDDSRSGREQEDRYQRGMRKHW